MTLKNSDCEDAARGSKPYSFGNADFETAARKAFTGEQRLREARFRHTSTRMTRAQA